MTLTTIIYLVIAAIVFLSVLYNMLTKEERNTRKKRTLDCLREAFAYADR